MKKKDIEKEIKDIDDQLDNLKLLEVLSKQSDAKKNYFMGYRDALVKILVSYE